MHSAWTNAIDSALARRREADAFRQRRIVLPIDATHIEVDGQVLVNFASNDYLGLSHNLQVIRSQQLATEHYGAGAGAAGLVSGYTPAHRDAELALARWKQTESAVLLSSGYAANAATVQALVALAGDRPVRFLIDKLSHASLLDAVRGSGSAWRVFPHNSVSKLRRLLADANTDELQVVATESIFSMDGAAADLAGIVQLKREFPFLLALDEAHGSGVFGKDGSGYADECGLAEHVDVTVATTSKAIGVAGGAICSSQSFCDAVVNFGRAYIYSTSVPANVAAAIQSALLVMQSEPDRQIRLRANARCFRQLLAGDGWPVEPGDGPIVPVVLGESLAALEASDRLCRAGFFAPAIRPPTVPPGTARLRITLSSEHLQEEVVQLAGELRAMRNSCRLPSRRVP